MNKEEMVEQVKLAKMVEQVNLAKMVEQVKLAKEVVNEVFPEEDPIIKAVVYTSLIKHLDITDIDDAPLHGVMQARKAIRITPPPNLQRALPGCPLITSLKYVSNTNNIMITWEGMCSYLNKECPCIEKALSFNDYFNCHTFTAKKILEAREKDESNNTED